jgi:hypothetical protein
VDSPIAETLRITINTRNLIKEDLLQLGGNTPTRAILNAVDHCKEDPILLDELIKMAEHLANKGSVEVWICPFHTISRIAQLVRALVGKDSAN